MLARSRWPKVCGHWRSSRSSSGLGPREHGGVDDIDDARAWWGVGLAVAVVGWGAQQVAPLLLMYPDELDLPMTTIQAVFGLYVLGLIPGLLLRCPASDRDGRVRSAPSRPSGRSGCLS